MFFLFLTEKSTKPSIIFNKRSTGNSGWYIIVCCTKKDGGQKATIISVVNQIYQSTFTRRKSVHFVRITWNSECTPTKALSAISTPSGTYAILRLGQFSKAHDSIILVPSATTTSSTELWL